MTRYFDVIGKNEVITINSDEEITRNDLREIKRMEYDVLNRYYQG